MFSTLLVTFILLVRDLSYNISGISGLRLEMVSKVEKNYTSKGFVLATENNLFLN